MQGPSKILLDEATRLMASTRRRIDLTLALLDQTPAPGGLLQGRLSARRVQPLEQGKDQLAPARLEPGVDAQAQPRR